MFLPKKLIKDVVKLGLEIRDSDFKEGRIYEMFVQSELKKKL